MPDLLPGESVLLTTPRHVITLLIPLLFVLVAAFFLVTRVCPIALELGLDGRCPVAAAGFLLVAAAVFIIDWLTTRLILTNRRLLLVQAPVCLFTQSLNLAAIKGLSLRVGLLGRVVGFGDITADSTATHGGRLIFDFTPRPAFVRDRIAAAVAASPPA